MTNETTRRPRPAVAGCAAVTALAAALILIAIGLIVAIAVPSFFESPEPSSEGRFGKQSGLTVYRLRQAAEDGRLTDAEIAHAAGAKWIAKRAPDATRIVVRYELGPACYQFDVSLPPGSQASVKRDRLKHCPAFGRQNNTA
ncbi:hypothetical protein [Streptomyces sp. NPDC087300]|uniref:hypothetical protein n=1 Tax=Streptomyces sp. NPDC087300 TaxID=3365780 RepID=UPI00380D8D7A